MRTTIAMLALLVASLGAWAGQVRAESAVASTDLALDFATDTTMPLPGSNLVVVLTIRNDGDFGAEEAIVSVPIPTGLTLLSADTSSGSYNLANGQWTTGAVDSFGSQELNLHLVVDVESGPVIVLVADLLSFTSTFGAFDTDSTPGNANPCEDDYAALTLSIAGVPLPDAGNGQVDAGSGCSGPLAPTDAGPAGNGEGDGGSPDAGGSAGSGSGGGCSVAHTSPTSWLLLLVGFCLAGLRLRRYQ